MRDYQLESFTEPGDWTCIIVRGVLDDDQIWEFDAQYERTNFPAEHLWGPGTREEAQEWVKGTYLRHDTVSYVDRLFAVRIYQGRASLARRPEIVLALPPERQEGRWLLVRADYPSDAIVHGQHVKDGVVCGGSVHNQLHERGNDGNAMPGCPLEELHDGNWKDLVALLGGLGVTDPAPPPSVRVPPQFPITGAADVEAD